MDFSQKNVLVVDDSTVMVRIIVNTLQRNGFRKISQAYNGKEALELHKKNNFDIIFTDWNMPVMNGLDLVKEIRKNDKDTTIIMITTEGGKTEVITALKSGVNNYIIKPFDQTTLSKKLNEIFS